MAKADHAAVELLRAGLRSTARRAIGGGIGSIGSSDSGDEEKAPVDADRPEGEEKLAEAGVKTITAASGAAGLRNNKENDMNGNYEVRYNDIGDVQIREEMLSRFLKAEQWGLKAWDNEYFKLLDYPPHVLRVIAPDRSPDAPRGTKAGPSFGGGGGAGRGRKKVNVKRPPPRRPPHKPLATETWPPPKSSPNSSAQTPAVDSSSPSRPRLRHQLEVHEKEQRSDMEQVAAALPLAHPKRRVGRADSAHRGKGHHDKGRGALRREGGEATAKARSNMPETPLRAARWVVGLLLAGVCASDTIFLPLARRYAQRLARMVDGH